jgi:hypothetical protein
MCLNLEEVTVTNAKDILEMLAKGELLVTRYPNLHLANKANIVISISLQIYSYNTKTDSSYIVQQELLEKSQYLHDEDSDERF